MRIPCIAAYKASSYSFLILSSSSRSYNGIDLSYAILSTASADLTIENAIFFPSFGSVSKSENKQTSSINIFTELYITERVRWLRTSETF